MRDLDAIDKQLRELGEPPRERSALITRVLGEDRSRARLDQLLATLNADNPAATHSPTPARAPAPAFSPAPAPSPFPPPRAAELDDDGPDTEETAPSEAAAMVVGLAHEASSDDGVAAALRGGASSDDGVAAALRGGASSDDGVAPALRGGATSERPTDPEEDEYEPELSLDAESEPPAPKSAPPEESSRFAAMFDFTNPPPPRESLPSGPVTARGPLSREPESPFDAPRVPYEDEPSADEEPTARRTAPPPPAPAAAADDDSDAEEADFELLVDDEDIIEIDDDEMQIVDDE